jgi:hypothetical protein
MRTEALSKVRVRRRKAGEAGSGDVVEAFNPYLGWTSIDIADDDLLADGAHLEAVRQQVENARTELRGQVVGGSSSMINSVSKSISNVGSRPGADRTDCAIGGLILALDSVDPEAASRLRDSAKSSAPVVSLRKLCGTVNASRCG